MCPYSLRLSRPSSEAMEPSEVSALGDTTDRSPGIGPGSGAWLDATVVLLVHHPGARELETVERVREQRYPGRVIVSVVDSSPDPSTASSRSIRGGADRWVAIPPESFGHAATRNLALREVATPVIVFLSQDAHPADGAWLEALVRPLQEGRAEASYGRQVSPSADPEREATFRYLYPEQPQIKTKDRIRELGLTAYHMSDVTSAFLTSVAQTLGFPEVPVFEDVGIAKRLLDHGHRIAYVPEAVVYHAHRMSPRETIRRYRDIGRVYEQLGIFSELRAAGRSLFRDGLTTARGVATRGPGLDGAVRSVMSGALKLAAVSFGRLETRTRSGETS